MVEGRRKSDRWFMPAASPDAVTIRLSRTWQSSTEVASMARTVTGTTVFPSGERPM